MSNVMTFLDHYLHLKLAFSVQIASAIQHIQYYSPWPQLDFFFDTSIITMGESTSVVLVVENLLFWG